MRQNRVQFLARLAKGVPSFFRGGPLRLTVDDTAYPLVSNELFDHTAGDQFLVTLEDPTGHSAQQRRLFHALVGEFSRQQGIYKPEVKRLMKHRHGVSEKIEVEGVSYLWLKSTTDYTKDEYSRLIDGTIHDCHEAGVEVEQYVAQWRGLHGA